MVAWRRSKSSLCKEDSVLHVVVACYIDRLQLASALDQPANAHMHPKLSQGASAQVHHHHFGRCM